MSNEKDIDKEREHYKHQHEYIEMAKECLEGEEIEKKKSKKHRVLKFFGLVILIGIMIYCIYY